MFLKLRQKYLNQSNKMILSMFLGYSFTFALAELGSKICHILDGLMVSNLLKDVAMASYGLTSPYNTLLAVFGAIIVTGSQSLNTRALGKGDKKETDYIFSLTVEITVIVSIIVTLLLFLFNNQICVLLGAKDMTSELFITLRSYNLGFFLAVPGLIIYPVLNSLVSIDGGKKYITIATIILSILDIVLNYVLSITLNMGMFGIGLSSAISQTIATLILVPLFFRKESIYNFSFVSIKLTKVCELVKIGLPKLTRKLSSTFKKIFMNNLAVLAGGQIMLTAMSIHNNISDLYSPR